MPNLVEDLDTPAVVIDLDIVEANIARAQAIQGAVQRPCAQPDPATGDLLDVNDDPVPVLAAVCQRGEDHEGRFLHRAYGHANVIYR